MQERCKNTYTAWCHRHIHICLTYTKKKLIESFSDHALEISETDRLSIDFIESHKSAGKRWVVSSEDLEMMYRKFDPGSDMVWWESDCNKAQEAEAPYQSERKGNYYFTRATRYGNKFSGPHYKLWAHLIENGQWHNVEWPPNMPIFGTKQTKKLQKESTKEDIANTALAITEHIWSPPHPNTSNTG